MSKHKPAPAMRAVSERERFLLMPATKGDFHDLGNYVRELSQKQLSIGSQLLILQRVLIAKGLITQQDLVNMRDTIIKEAESADEKVKKGGTGEQQSPSADG